MQWKIEWTYEIPKTKQTIAMDSEWIDLNCCIALLQDLEKTGRLKHYDIYDQHASSWTKKQLIQYSKKHETKPHDIKAYIDGGYDVATKLAGIGVAIYFKKDGSNWRIRFNDQLELLEDNNEAEYAALYRLLQQLELIDVENQEITVYLDSLTVEKQATGQWPCYEDHYANWLDRIEELQQKLRITIRYEQINRSKNKEADQLATQALNNIIIESKIEADAK